MSANTLLLRLEGPLQAWGDQQSKFVIRRTADGPTKSGVMGMILAAIGVPRAEAGPQLAELNRLCIGVRIDRPGTRWWDYHTVGAEMQMQIAEAAGKSKPGAMLTRREYLCDASFLVALQGEPDLIARAHAALRQPAWPLYLGRKSCPASVPLIGRSGEPDLLDAPDLAAAFRTTPWHPRTREDHEPQTVECLLEWRPRGEADRAPTEAEVWYDVAESFDVPAHAPRFVIRTRVEITVDSEPRQHEASPPLRPRADYTNSTYRRVRTERLQRDQHLCVFCKAPATTVQHVTYRHAGGEEQLDELRSLCRLCHDAVTMIEYGQGMTLDRINPEDPRWRHQIIEKRQEIVAYRSLETRRRRLNAEEVE